MKTQVLLVKNARQQEQQVQAGLHPQGFGGVSPDVVFQPEQHVQIAHQHIQRGVQEQEGHQHCAALAQTESGGQGFCKEGGTNQAHHGHDQQGKPGAGRKHGAAGGTFRRLPEKSQQTLVQTQHPQIHQGSGVGHEGRRHGVAVGGQNPLHYQGGAADEKAQIGGHRILHQAGKEGLLLFMGLGHDRLLYCKE